MSETANLERVAFSSTQLARASGLTYRMLDFYTRCGVLVPMVAAAGSGSARAYDEREAVMARIVAALQSLRAPTKVMRAVVDQLRGLPELRYRIYIDTEGNVHRAPTPVCWSLDLDALAQ